MAGISRSTGLHQRRWRKAARARAFLQKSHQGDWLKVAAGARGEGARSQRWHSYWGRGLTNSQVTEAKNAWACAGHGCLPGDDWHGKGGSCLAMTCITHVTALLAALLLSNFPCMTSRNAASTLQQPHTHATGSSQEVCKIGRASRPIRRN